MAQLVAGIVIRRIAVFMVKNFVKISANKLFDLMTENIGVGDVVGLF